MTPEATYPGNNLTTNCTSIQTSNRHFFTCGESWYKVGVQGKRGFVFCVSSHMTRQATYPGNNLTTNRTTVILKFAKNLQDVCTYGESWYKVGMNGKMEFVICVSSHMTPKATYPGKN